MANDDSWHAPLVAAGIEIPDAGMLIRRHLGLTLAPESWGAPLFDVAPSARCEITDADLLACGVLGVRINKSLLDAWPMARLALNAIVPELSSATSLEDADDVTLARICTAITASELDVSVAAKLLHRVRPRLVPPIDRTVIDWYGRALNDRAAGRLPAILGHLRSDLLRPDNRSSLIHLQHTIAAQYDGALAPTRLRLFDIALWMADHRS